MNSLELQALGSLQDAESIFARFFASSPAYRRFVGDKHSAFINLPFTTKANFYSLHEWKDLLPPESFAEMYAVLRSSGSSGGDEQKRGFFWPKIKSRDRASAAANQALIVRMLDLEKRKTLFIVGLSLGSWAGGEEFSFLFKSIALRSELPLVAFSPGNQHLEILEIITKCGQHFDQVLISLCPSAIFYLERLAESTNVALPKEKIAFLVTGEPFPEELRLSLQSRGYAKALGLPPMLSAYGSADTGFVGFESEPLVRLRQALSADTRLANALGFTSSSIPNLYHASILQSYFECLDEELVVTQ